MIVRSDSLSVSTRGADIIDITGDIAAWLRQFEVEDGLLSLFIQHTSASLAVQENADPDVLRDLKDALARLAPEGPHYRHSMEGPDDMPAHIKSVLTPVSLSVPVKSGRLMLGTWQGIYVLEHRAHPHKRRIALNLIGQAAGDIS